MEERTLGRTGLRVSALGFGCGNVGGLMVRAAAAERERAVARALELGINYFDTAPSYGNGESERNLGQALRALRADVRVGTKFRVDPSRPAELAAALARSLEASLVRLGRDSVDLLQLHNSIADERRVGLLAPRVVLEALVPALEKLVEQGKTRAFGITALGPTAAVQELLGSAPLHTAQVCFNLLNPSAAYPVPAGLAAQDFGGLLLRCGERGIGAIAIRTLAAGALSGSPARHPIAVPSVAPIASGPDYAGDVRRAGVFRALVDEGHVESLIEASLRFVLSSPAVSTLLVGYSSLEQLEHAASCVARGALPAPALARLPELWRELAAQDLPQRS
jgi:aryl-alcohol dehydrogenase-like predicted oxidoreductase